MELTEEESDLFNWEEFEAVGSENMQFICRGRNRTRNVASIGPHVIRYFSSPVKEKPKWILFSIRTELLIRKMIILLEWHVCSCGPPLIEKRRSNTLVSPLRIRQIIHRYHAVVHSILTWR